MAKKALPKVNLENKIKKDMMYLGKYFLGYMVILDSGKKLIGDVLRYMINELSIYKRNAMVIHCTAGKDRTGVFIMILLGICGVDDEIIAREYELSNLGYFGKYQTRAHNRIVELI